MTQGDDKMAKALLIQVTVYDDETREVGQQFVRHYEGSYGYEVEKVFDVLGQKVAKVIDPDYED